MSADNRVYANAVVLLNINYKTHYGNHYGDETMCSSISYKREGLLMVTI